MGFARYVDYALDVPLYFVKRGDYYHDVAGPLSATFSKGGFRNCRANTHVSDWANHLSTLFPKCGSNAISNAAAPMSGRDRIFTRWPRSAPDCFMTQRQRAAGTLVKI